MCGIAGYIGLHRPSEDKARACLTLMRHRGPDGSGEYRVLDADGQHVLLLHSRLAIIDLDMRSNQPFRSGQLVLSFNGEIYNYLELRAGLEQMGESFATASDTEVLARGLALRGSEFLAKCEGMWALAAYDEDSGTLLLSRDRFGEKPLWLYRAEHGLYFASEVKLLAALAGIRFQPNLRHLSRYLVYGYRRLFSGQDTFFHGIEPLEAGTWLSMGPHGQEDGRYWMPRFAPEEAMTYEEAVAGARERLLEAVQLRLRADVPLAFCLSGGVDSNTLVSIAKRVFGYDVHGFTIANTDERYAEQDLVANAVTELGIRHTSVPLRTSGFLPGLRKLVRTHDAPVSTITWYAHWLLMERVAAHGYKISITGSAADELFTGYYDHQLMYLAAVSGNPELYAEALAHWRKHVAPSVRNPVLRNPTAFIENPGLRAHLFPEAERWASCLLEPFCEDFAEERHCDEVLRNRMLNELRRESVPVILHEDDLNAMHFSIENRSPFLDSALAAHCLRIPARHLVRHGYAKAVLREAMRGIVPDAVLDNRIKTGFNAPIEGFLDRGDASVRAEALADGPLWGHVRRKAIQELLDKPALTSGESAFLFSVLCAKMFLEEYA